MDRYRVLAFFYCWRMYINILAMSGAALILINEFVRRNQEGSSLAYNGHIRDIARGDVIDRIIRNNDNNCIWELRMCRNTFGRLCELLKVQGGLVEDGKVLIEEQVAIFLNILAHHKKNRDLQVTYYRSGETISRYVHRVLLAVLRLENMLLAQPEPVPQDCTDDRWKYFKNCLGALDGTYIAVTVPATDSARYRTRKGHLATNVLGVCTQDMQFVYVLSGWEGSAADSRVLRDAIIRPNGLKIPVGCYYLVDAGYTNGEGFLAPYRGRRYHLQEWSSSHQSPRNREELFNLKHASARNVIERCFGLLKKRWAILRSPSFYPIKTQNRIILACCLLHNFIRICMSLDPEEHSPLTSDAVPVGEDRVDMVGVVEPSNEWSQWRDDLATQMFTEWQANRNI